MRVSSGHAHVSTACYLAGVVRLLMPITFALCKYFRMLLHHVVLAVVLDWSPFVFSEFELVIHLCNSSATVCHPVFVVRERNLLALLFVFFDLMQAQPCITRKVYRRYS